MRILFVSNLYPPVVVGGYEMLCHEVGQGLVARGHEVHVLTTRRAGDAQRATEKLDGIEVHRWLNLEVEGGVAATVARMVWRRKQLEQEDALEVRAALSVLAPDAVMCWGMWNLPRSVPAALERFCPDRLAYYICDYWPALPIAYLQKWLAPARRTLTRPIKQFFRRPFVRWLEAEARPALRMEHAFCVSRATRDILVQKRLPLRAARIIYGNAKPDQFGVSRPRRETGGALRLLCLGRLGPEKGVQTAIRGLAELPPTGPARVTLDVYGTGEPGREHTLQTLVARLGLGERVAFHGGVPRASIPAVLAEHDVLVFPSEWEEPFARTVLEAMAAGLAVVGTTTGGTGEVLVEGETGLTFPAGDAAALARQVSRLLDDPALLRRLAEGGRRAVNKRFTFEKTLDGIEAALKDAALGASECAPPPSTSAQRIHEHALAFA